MAPPPTDPSPDPQRAEYPAAFYAALHAGTPGDREWYARQCRGARRILELGCGEGRVLEFLLDADPALSAEGVDLHEGLLQRARDRLRAQREARRLTLHLGDMSAQPLAAEAFDAVLMPYGGLYGLDDHEALVDLLKKVSAGLRTGGQLLADVWAADDFHQSSEPEDHDDAELTPLGPVEVEGSWWQVFDRSSWDKDAQLVHSEYHYLPAVVRDRERGPELEEDGARESVIAPLRQRYFLRAQLEEALGAAGFDAVEIFGDFDERPYGEDSELLVLRARRKP